MTRTHDVERTESFPCDGPAALDVRMRAGRLAVRTGAAPEIRVQVSAEPGEPGEPAVDAIRETEISFSESSRRLVIRTPRGFRRAQLAVTVDVPERTRVTARLHRGSVDVAGSVAALDAASGSGDIRAERIAGDAETVTGAGSIRLGEVEGRLRARSGSGEIEVASLDGEAAKVSTGRGDVWLGAVRSDVQARTGGGNVFVADVASGRLDLATGSGNVSVSVRPGVSAEIDLASGSGHARSDLDVLDRPPAGSPSARIRARTGAGDAVVARAESPPTS